MAVLATTYALHAFGFLSRFEHALAEARAGLLAHEVDSNIVIVGIDAQSLAELSEWPWPRRHHARLLQHLERAAPRSVFLDIDFSSVSSVPDDDDMLERAFEAWPGEPVLLAAHYQPLNGVDGELVLRRPLPRFARHAREVSVILERSADGLVREMRSSIELGGEQLRSIVGYETPVPAGTPVPIDFSIAISSFGYVPYSDLLNGEIDLASLEGRDLYVGAMAMELGDMIPVPVFQNLPGVVVQALASESARAGVVGRLPEWLYLVILAAVTGASAWRFRAQTWRMNSIVSGAGVAAAGAATTYLYAAQRVDLPIVPVILVLGGLFVAAALRSLDHETWRALAYAVGFKRRDALLKSIVESSTDCIVCVDGAGVIRTANPAASLLFGCPPRSLLGAEIGRFLLGFKDSRSALSDALGAVSEHWAVSAQNRKFPVEISLSRVAIEEEALFTAIIRDISERKMQQRQLEHQATHDPLTQLPNRAALNSYLDSVLAEQRVDRRVALLMLDLCRFKEVNDTLGHDVGDAVLREVSRRFADTLTERAFIGRIGGDEFTVVLPDVGNKLAIDNLSERLVEALRTPIQVSGVAIDVGLSIGVALWPDHARDAQELLRHADIAMYVAKRRNHAYEYYSHDQDQHTVRRLSMVGELRAAISRNEISLRYQPQVNLQTGQVEGAEALLRWQHAVHGNVSPEEFVALAESTDLIQPLTDWTITEGLKQMERWDRRGFDRGFRLAVNLSARALQDVELPVRLKYLLETYSFDPERLELEITESAMMLDPDRARCVVRDLHALGLLISIDDYGTGFSSLGYLRDLRVHALKLDKSFVTDLETHVQNRVIVESTAHMAHALGLRVVAEGVETKWVRDYLKNVGYDLGQGYWFARALTADEYFDWAMCPEGRREAG